MDINRVALIMSFTFAASWQRVGIMENEVICSVGRRLTPDLPSGFCTFQSSGTAAHCLFERDTARKIDVKAVFRAGYERQSLFERRVVSLMIAGVSYNGPIMMAKDAALDVAILRLDRVSFLKASPFTSTKAITAPISTSHRWRGGPGDELATRCNVMRQNAQLWVDAIQPLFLRRPGVCSDGNMHSARSRGIADEAGENRTIGMKLNGIVDRLSRTNRRACLRFQAVRNASWWIVRPVSGAKFLSLETPNSRSYVISWTPIGSGT